MPRTSLPRLLPPTLGLNEATRPGRRRLRLPLSLAGPFPRYVNEKELWFICPFFALFSSSACMHSCFFSLTRTPPLSTNRHTSPLPSLPLFLPQTDPHPRRRPYVQRPRGGPWSARSKNRRGGIRWVCRRCLRASRAGQEEGEGGRGGRGGEGCFPGHVPGGVV